VVQGQQDCWQWAISEYVDGPVHNIEITAERSPGMLAVFVEFEKDILRDGERLLNQPNATELGSALRDIRLQLTVRATMQSGSIQSEYSHWRPRP
jgi:hypothetical protein